MNLVTLRPYINQTGGANGITRGLYINPQIVSAANWKAIEVVTGATILGDTTDTTGAGTGALQVSGGAYVAKSVVIDAASNALRISNSQTPASASAIGTTGTIAWDGSYIYVCTATNTWKRAAIATW